MHVDLRHINNIEYSKLPIYNPELMDVLPLSHDLVTVSQL